jgi:hypothetical protein
MYFATRVFSHLQQKGGFVSISARPVLLQKCRDFVLIKSAAKRL